MKSIIKFSIGVAVIASLTTMANAKFEHRNTGQVYLGEESTDIATVPNGYEDSITMLKIHGPYTEWRAGGRLSFGDQAAHTNLNVLVGELDTIDSDILWMHGKYGLYYTAKYKAQDTIFYYDVNRGTHFQFNCDVHANGIFVASDQRFKENISPLNTTLASLKSISPVTYRLKQRLSDNDDDADVALTEKEKRDRQRFGKFRNELNNDSIRYGFIAQEVQKIYPELVKTDKSGYMYVDYIGMIPVLVNAINELQNKISSLESGKRNDVMSEKSTNPVDNLVNDIIVAKLEQNAPNPFNSETVIAYSLPEEVASAQLYIYNMQGRQIKKYDLAERGNCSLTISASEFDAGMYIYALIADGKEIDSKRMILTE